MARSKTDKAQRTILTQKRTAKDEYLDELRELQKPVSERRQAAAESLEKFEDDELLEKFATKMNQWADLPPMKQIAEVADDLGMSETQARSLARTDKIKALMLEHRHERMERTKIDADWVLTELGDMMEADIADIIDENNCYRPIADWPKVWRKMLQGVDIEQIFEGRGKDREHVGNVVKIKFIDRLKALDMIGKHIDVQAFKEVVEHQVGEETMNRVEQARNRVKEKGRATVVR